MAVRSISSPPCRRGALGCWLAIVVVVGPASFCLRAQNVLFQEGFNTDGEAAQPRRYTTEGREVYEKARQEAELGLTTQDGPIYWAHNFEISFVGVPAPTPARRAVLAWHHTIPADTVSEDFLTLFDSTIRWMVNNKTGATICFSPGPAGSGDDVLADRLRAKGYTVTTDDDGAQPLPAADAYIHSSNGDLGNPSRLTSVNKPVLTYRAADHDDMLVSSIGQTVTFTPSEASINAPEHAAAGGKTGSFPVLTGGDVSVDLIGDVIPGGATVVASFVRVIPPTAGSLADVDALVSGSKPSQQSQGTITETDLSLNSPGDWFLDNAYPGSPQDTFAMVAKGKLHVTQPGTYSFGMGVDDGGRLRIDRDRNGFSDADNIIVEDVTGAHRAVFGDAAFAAAGDYDFEWTTFNAGGAASSELSIAITPGGGETSPIASGAWDLLGYTPAGAPVSLQGSVSVKVYVPTGAPEEVELPMLMVLEAPADGGAVFGGGPFSNFEGAGFFAGSGLNKWTYPNGVDRLLTLPAVSVAGEEDVKLTVALAATFLDFETSDYLDLYAYPNGLGGAEVLLARYSAPDANTKYFVDTTHGGINQLNLQFKDVTYDIPAGATDLVIQFRAATTWWNEIVGIDNVRITAGALVEPTVAVRKSGGDVLIEFTGALESATSVQGPYTPVPGNPGSPYTLTPALQTGHQFFRSR